MGACEAPYGREVPESAESTRCESECASGELVAAGACVPACPEGTYRVDDFCNATCTGSRRYHLGSACAFACPEFTMRVDSADSVSFQAGAGSTRWICVSECPYFWRVNADQ